MTVLFCEDVPELKLGPGRLEDTPDNILRFREGFAEIDRSDPNYDEKMRWVTAGGTPKIEVLGDREAEGRMRADDPQAFVCSKCQKGFKNQFALNGHMMSHAPKAAAG